MLQRPWTQGELACPDFFYFLVALLSHAHNWLILDDTNSAVVLEAACVGSFETLLNVLFRGVKVPHPLTTSMKTVIRAWTHVTPLIGNHSRWYAPDTPLWITSHYQNFFSTPEPSLAAGGISYLAHICKSGVLQTFNNLK